MKVLYIKKSWKFLPLEVINALIFLAPVLFAFVFELPLYGLILLSVYLLLVFSISVYVIVYLRYQTGIVISDHGVELEKKLFLKWETITSYFIKEESKRYYSADIGYQNSTSLILHITLDSGNLVRFPVGQLREKPEQIIKLFDERKATSGK